MYCRPREERVTCRLGVPSNRKAGQLSTPQKGKWQAKEALASLERRLQEGEASYLSQERVLGSEVSPLLPYPAGYEVAKFLPEASYLPFGPPSLVPPSCFISHTGEQSSQLTPCLFESPAVRTEMGNGHKVKLS